MKEYKLKINGNSYAVVVQESDSNIASVSVNGTTFTVEHEGISTRQVQRPIVISKVEPLSASPTLAEDSATQRASAPKANAGGVEIKSPLPGTILDIMVKEGATVKTGDRLILLEAMKMENNIDADRDGVVKIIHVSKGDSVLEGASLITIE